jgi:hypothetical protein
MYGGFDPMRGPMGGGMGDVGVGPKSAEKKVGLRSYGHSPMSTVFLCLYYLCTLHAFRVQGTGNP